MPDPLLILSAMGVAFAAASISLALIGWSRRQAVSALFDAGWTLGIGAGFFLGCWVLGSRPHWPPRDDQDRLLALVFPAVMLVEVLAVFPRVPRWLVWPLRLALLAAAARVLLHGTSYITDSTGPGTSEWSPTLAWLIFGGMSALTGAVWGLLSVLAGRSPGPSLPTSLAVATVAAGVTVMLSGYLSGGQVALPLAAALMGVTASAVVLNRKTPQTGPLGVAIAGLFCVLLIGRFFGELTTAHAVVLLCAPLLAWFTELPYVRRAPSWGRGLARVILVAIVASVVVVLSAKKAAQDFKSSSGANSSEPSVDDYMNFGK